MRVIYQHPGPAGIQSAELERELLAEEPLAIRIDGQPYVVVMRTPGLEKEHALGFCLGEGLIDSPADAATVALCDGEESNVVTVTLAAGRREAAASLLERKGFVSQSSCGICGKELIEDLHQVVSPLGSGPVIDIEAAIALLAGLDRWQPLRKTTRAAHAVVLLDGNLEFLASAEDVGRHNALDKAVGQLLARDRLAETAVAALSSRISYEMVQKAGRAGIGIILALSRPTALAVDMARSLNMALAALENKDGLVIYCGWERFGLAA